MIKLHALGRVSHGRLSIRYKPLAPGDSIHLRLLSRLDGAWRISYCSCTHSLLSCLLNHGCYRRVEDNLHNISHTRRLLVVFPKFHSTITLTFDPIMSDVYADILARAAMPPSPNATASSGTVATPPRHPSVSDTEAESFDFGGAQIDEDDELGSTSAIKRKAPSISAAPPAKRVQLRDNPAQYVPGLISTFKLTDDAAIHFRNFSTVLNSSVVMQYH
jgi:hypothetical protein